MQETILKLQETRIPMLFQQEIQQKGYLWDISDTTKVYDVFMLGISDFLTIRKRKDRKVALSINDLKGELLLAAVVEYHPNENETMPGNWSYTFTFDKADIVDADVVLSTDQSFVGSFVRTAHGLYGMGFNAQDLLHLIIETCVKSLKQCLSENANSNGKFVIVQDGYFQASVEVEKNEPCYEVVPEGPMKKIVKGDRDLEI